MLVDGMTAANDLGLTTAVPTRVVIHTDTRRRSIHLSTLLADRRHGRDLRDDLRAGFATLPAWMQDLLRKLVGPLAVRPATAERRRRAPSGARVRARLERPQGIRP